MKKFTFFMLFLFAALIVSAQQAPFITTWFVHDNNLNIEIPTRGSGYDYNVDFGDGTVLTNMTGDASHTYLTQGYYTVTISGDFPRIYFGNYWNSTRDIARKIRSIEQWGDNQWVSMGSAFQGCWNLTINATDTPDLSQVTDMSYMFSEVSFNDSINHWDVSNVIDMGHMFADAGDFNQPLDNWNVSNVADMRFMFSEADDFNQSLNNWDVSNVSDMTGMFWNCNRFNQPVDNWDVSGVTNMSSLFSGARLFDQPLNDWDVSNVTSMASMFKRTDFFNQPLNDWDVSNVTDMNEMFLDAVSFDQYLNDWDVSSVTNMYEMFGSGRSPSYMGYNQPLNNWDVSSVISMGGMFKSNNTFNQPLDEWNVSNVLYFEGMFDRAIAFNQDLSNWDITSRNLENFLRWCALDITNFDAFLSHLAILGISNGTLGAEDVQFCNQDVIDYLENQLGWNIYGQIHSDSCNSIIGTILYDIDDNGCDANDIGMNGFMVNANDGMNDLITFSNNGNYTLGTIGTNFSVSLINVPDYFTADPESANVVFTSSNIEEVNFCITADQNIKDLNITLLALTDARPGFEITYQWVVQNRGTNNISDVGINLVFNDDAQVFLQASQTPVSYGGNELIFEVANLAPFNQQTINITMETFAPPVVNGGDILNLTANVTPVANDYTPDDNTYVLNQIVVNSFDPNDKQVMQGEEIHISESGNYLDYLIRFQNTGTASAVNVRILDTLNPKLDWSTIQPINSSHDYRVEISNGNKVEFIFDGIDLPHEAGNEPESHGWVAYKIKPRNNVQVGDVISGDASIYFDYNPPIITNTVSTVIIDDVVGVSDNTVLADHIKIYPNPAGGMLNIQMNNDVNLESLIIYGLQWQEILKSVDRSVDVGNLTEGLYFIKIITDQGTVNHRFIKN